MAKLSRAVALDTQAEVARTAAITAFHLGEQAERARYADLIVVARDALAEARELDGNQDRRHRAIDAALAVLDEEP